MQNENPFEGFEVVSRYTDEQAVDDGVLVSLSLKDRVTRAVWEFFCSIAPVDEKTQSEYIVNAARDSFARTESAHYLNLHGARAREVYEKNIGGGIFKLDYSNHIMWIIPNELGGLTLMFPEDY